MILADADVIFRWTDNSLSVTGWGWWLLIVVACCASSTYRSGK